ncbi:MAG: uroporphyrinogen-III C-methyltransferase [Planctomycetota bacterium]
MATGVVHIIGAGPGGPDLITLRGYRALRQANLVIFDKLLPPSFLDDLDVRPDVKRIWLGDGAGRRDQDAINALMLEAAKEGRTVVRLKCGDPFVFGRGAEETDFLTAHGIPWEVVPGLTAAVAASSNAALPLTDRQHSHSFAAATARRAGGGVAESFPRADSLVIFMGVRIVAGVTAELIREGWPANTPCVVVERATMPWERRVTGPLDTISESAKSAEIRSPAVLLVGSVARRAEERPRILYTGLDPAHFRVLGDILHWPALHVVADDAGHLAVPRVFTGLTHREFDWVIFTSRVGVRSFFAALETQGTDARLLGVTQIAAAGAGTAQSLREHGIVADVVPSHSGSDGILDALAKPGQVLLVQGSHAPRKLVEALEQRGARVTRLALHRVEPNPELGRPLPAHDVIYFTSPSGVRSWHDTYGDAAFRREIWCIGNVTLQQVEELGFDGKVVSPHGSVDTTKTTAAV